MNKPTYSLQTVIDASATEVILLTDRPERARLMQPVHDRSFTVMSDLSAAGPQVSVIVVDYISGSQLQDQCRKIRSDVRYAHIPLYYVENEPASQSVKALCDGSVRSPKEALEKSQAIRAVLARFPQDTHGERGADMMLLQYLASRPHYVLEPQRSWLYEEMYAYPLLDALKTPGTSAMGWLERLSGLHMLETVALIDRCRYCPQCNCGHLHFIDRCTHCQSIDLKPCPMFHCFACGNIAPDHEYFRAGRIECKKCNSNLQSYGVDYDHALTSVQCLACHAQLMSPTTVANCMRCESTTFPENLPMRYVRSWRLSDVGRAIARTGNMYSEMFNTATDRHFVSPVVFSQAIDWFQSLREGRTDIHFVLVGLRLAEVERMAIALAGTLRTADLMVTNGADLLLVLLPYAGENELAHFDAALAEAQNEMHATIEKHVISSAHCHNTDKAASVIARLKQLFCSAG